MMTVMGRVVGDDDQWVTRREGDGAVMMKSESDDE